MLLQDKFIVPPTSILDARTGNWIVKSRSWADILQNIDIYDGIPENVLAHNEQNTKFDVKYQKCFKTKSIFSPLLCEIIYKWFSNKDNLILDPFAGSAIRGLIAGYTHRKYIGVDVREEQVKSNYIAKNQFYDKYMWKLNCKWICGDSKNINTLLNCKMFDLIFTCPPYYNLERYSTLNTDLSNNDNYDAFLFKYSNIIKNSIKLLKDNRFCIIAVSNMRDKKTQEYYNLVGDTIEICQSYGLKLYNDIIYVQPTGSLPQRCGRWINSTRKIGKQHQNILVFYKGDISKIKSNFSNVEL